MIELEMPGRKSLEFHHLLLDMNGTLTADGVPLKGVAEKLSVLKSKLNVCMLTADTFGTGARVAEDLGIQLFVVSPIVGAEDKADFAAALEPAGVVAIGNGYNDRQMFKNAQLSIAVVGPEGCCVESLKIADICVNDINDALDMLLNPVRITATLRR